jgi:hypothetical protein
MNKQLQINKYQIGFFFILRNLGLGVHLWKSYMGIELKLSSYECKNLLSSFNEEEEGFFKFRQELEEE